METICAPTPPTGLPSRRKRAAKAPAADERAERAPVARFSAASSTGPSCSASGASSALAGVFAYYASQLPPIDQLAVPKRPPNIAILADDGALIANRGDTGGAAVRLIDLPPYLPKAFVAIEDRRFYSAFRHRSGRRLARASCAT